jgi:tetratricopeptide (TPR) repeat protein
VSVPASERLITLAVYNPDLLNKEDLIRGFVARKPLLDRLLDDLRRETRDDTPPQPYLILGQRGLGKTTLLRRLAYAIEDDPDLGAAWVPLVFPEEQYNVAMLSDFWLNCVDALGDAIERGGNLAAYRALDARVEGMPGAEPERRRQALELLVAEADRLRKRLMLLIDNIDIVFDRLGDKDDWEFRRILSSEPRLLLIGASSRALEAVYDYGRSFYDFFQIHELKGLDEAETFELLQSLAEQTDQPGVAALLTRHPARIRTLRLLTGGNPRTLVVLFRILAQSPDGEVDRDLEQLLDLHTPLYKARFEELSTQAQQVLDAMAIHWDPLTAALLAEAARLPVNQVSAQLQRLEDSGVVEKTEWHGEKKAAYQIAERFFNIWYLMRASRRVRRKLIWLVKFLEIWFDQEELRTRAQAYLRKSPDNADRQRYAERAFAYAQAIKHRPLSTALEHAGLHALIDDDKVRRLIDFSDLPPELQDKRLRMERMRELHEQVRTVALDWGGIDREVFWRLLGGSPPFTLEEKTRIVQRLEEITPTELQTLFESLQRQHERIIQVYRREGAVVEKLYDALAGGDMADVYDVEAVVSIAENEEYRLLPYVAVQSRVSRFLTPETLPESELRQADAALRQLMEHEPLKAMAWNGLGNLLSHRLQRHEEAEQAYRRAIELDPKDARPWYNLGNLLSDPLQRYEEAEHCYRRAIELDPKDARPWYNLGNLLSDPLQRYEEAEHCYRRAIELDPKDASLWCSFGVLLSDHLERDEEAEQCFRRAIALDPRNALLSENLGILLGYRLRRHAEGGAAFLQALQSDRSLAESRLGLLEACRTLLADRATQEQAVALLRRGLELLSGDAGLKATLAQGLAMTGQWPEAQELLADIAQGAEWELSFTSLFAAIVATDHAKEALAVLEQAGAHEGWRPLYEALRAAAEGSAKYLRRIAPEVRVVAEKILREIAPHLYET